MHGCGKLSGPRTVAVGDQRFAARLGVVIATGSKPAIPPIPDHDEVDFWTTHHVIAAEILGRVHPAARYDAVPRVTFTDPEVGAVGMTESEARAAGLDVVVAVKRLPATFRGWLHAAADGVIKLVADRKTGVLVGAMAAGPHGGEMLGLLSLAVHARVPLAELRSMIYAFPTFYGGIGEAVGAYGRGLMTVLDPAYQDFEGLDAVGVDE